MPLPVRGKENIEINKAKLAVLKTKEELNQLKNSFEKEIETLFKKSDSSIKNYHRFIKELIPKQKKITRLLKTKNRVGKADMIQVINSQNLTLTLRELSLDALNSHFKAYGKLRYYQ
jgi:outer membrane protein TolC